MPKLSPIFSTVIGSFRSSTANPVGGPTRLVIARDMDVPADAMELVLMDRKGIAPGDPVTVELGYDDAAEPVFTGEVAEIVPTLYGTRVRALGRMNALLKLRKASTYENQAAGSIVNDLVSAAGLEAGTLSDGPTLPRFAIDQRSSAFFHIKGLADRLGYDLYTDKQGKVMFQALGAAAKLDTPGGGLLGAAVSALVSGAGGEAYQFGKHLVCAAASRRPKVFASVVVGGESPMSGQGGTTAHWLTTNDVDFRGSAGDGEPHLLVLDPAARTKDLAARFAAGLRAVAARRENEISLTVFGRPSLELGQDVTVADTPDPLAAGKGYVRAIRHRFGDGAGFLSDIRVAAEAS